MVLPVAPAGSPDAKDDDPAAVVHAIALQSVVAGSTDIFRGRGRSALDLLGLPIALAVICALLFAWVGTQQLDSIEQRLLATDKLTLAFSRHLVLAFVSTVLVILIAVPLGILLTRPGARAITPPVIAIANMGQAIPSIGVLVLLALVWSIGFWPSIVALVAYSALPVLRNTMVGLQQVDPFVIEAGRGMGMTKRSVLRKIELPLAVPVILAGIRTALVINVGTATLATFVNAGGLGDIINGGLVTNRQTVTIVGSVVTASLALFIDHLGGIAESRLSPKGI